MQNKTLDGDNAVIARRDLLLVRLLTLVSVQCASDCDSEKLYQMQVIQALCNLRPLLNHYFITFRCMSLVLVDYTIQAVWSFFNNWLIFIMDRKTRIASGEEEMLPHIGKRSVDLIILRLHFFLGTFSTYTTLA
jgi:hypothetical protein